MSRLLFILLFFFLRRALAGCDRNATLAGRDFYLTMVQHQLRGRLTVVDGCSFSVSGLDLLPGGPNSRWWAAAGSDLANLTSGRPVSGIPLNSTFRNASLTFPLLPSVSWDAIPILAAFDPDTAADFGYVALPHSVSELLPAPAPAPSPSGSSNASAPEMPPTMFDNCVELSPRYRLRWTLDVNAGVVDLGLEAAVGSEFYMAFGWAALGAVEPSMIGADVAVTGFTEDGMPFSEDYYITKYSECLLEKEGKVEGVCPDTIYEGSDPAGTVNNTQLVYGHRRDGVSFVRYQRPIESSDKKYDVPIKVDENMTVIWALGPIRPPDALRPYYLPQNHGAPSGSSYGFLSLNVSEKVGRCLGPLDAVDKEDQDRLTAERNTPLVVTSGPALRYSNPPNPSKVLYINKKEAPLLTVERGVPVTFSIQAGHDVALYITSDPIGGNATARNMTEVIYAGGSQFEGVPASPKELHWLPDRNTPDLVYYQSLYDMKMGWKVQVVDGGLSDMYNNSVLLDDQQVTFFWTLFTDKISIAARGEKKSGYVAIGFGTTMINSYAYVGWIDTNGTGHVNSYYIDGRDAMNIHPTSENLTYVRCKSENGAITFEFTRPLIPGCNGRVECKNIIDPTTPLKVIWAMGAQWSDDSLSVRNMHSLTSSHPVRVLLSRGSAEAEQDLRPVLAVHGFMMFVAWGFLLPGGILAARYMKNVKGDSWFQTHVYLQYSGIAIMLLGILFAVSELKGFYMSSLHVKFGVSAIVLGSLQPLNAYFRPKKPVSGEAASTMRTVWEYFHAFTGRAAVVLGTVALFTGLQHLGQRYGSENVRGLTWGLIIWVVAAVSLVVYLEYKEVKRRRAAHNLSGSWVLGNIEDDSVDLLHSDRRNGREESHSPGTMEIQLEPLNR